MPKNRLFLALVATFFFANACGENGRLPTDVYQVKKVTASATACAPFDQTRALAVTLFGDKGNGSVPKKLDGVLAKLVANDVTEARTLGMNLIKFITNEARAKHISGTQAQVTQLVNEILCLILVPATVGAAEDAFVITPNNSVETVVNSEGTAGAVLPPNAVSEPTIITIAPIPFTSTGPGTGPLHTKLDQYPGYFFLSQISATNAPLLQPVVVAVCPASSVPKSIRSRLRLGHDAATGFELTPRANAAFLVCPVSAPAVSEASTAGESFTRISKSSNIIDLLEATGGVGGTTGTFSPFGTVDETLSATGGVGGTTGTFIQLGDQKVASMFNGQPLAVASCSEAPLGTAVPQACRPTVSVTTLLGTKLQNVPVTFNVTQGGGTTAEDASGTCGAFGTSAVVTTNNFGIAIACWTLGAAAGVNTIVATPATGGDVPATAVFQPATLTFTIAGVIVDDTPPVIGDPQITGAIGADGWYTSDVTVTWPVSDNETSFTSSGCSATLSQNTVGTTFTCSATNAVGLVSRRSVTLKRDNVVPTVAVEVSGTKGKNDWFTSDARVKWTVVTAGVSGGSVQGCTDLDVTENGDFSYQCVAYSGAGLRAFGTARVKRDASTPTIDVALRGTHGNNDWFTSSVGVDWTVTPNGPSGLGTAVGCGDFEVSTNGAFSYECSVESGAGVSAARSTAVNRDATVPVVEPVISGRAGKGGWFIGDVDVTWAVTANGPSGQGTRTGCDAVSLTTDGQFTYQCTAETGAGVSTTNNALIKRDASVPTVGVALNGTEGRDHWFTTNVGIDWTVTANGPSSLGTLVGCSDSEVSRDGADYKFTCTAESGAGVSAAASTGFKRDASVPTVGVALLGTEGKDHWFTTNVGIDWTVTPNGPSSLGTLVGCTDSEVSRDGADYRFVCTAESGAGLSAVGSTSFKRDASVPTVGVALLGTEGNDHWFTSNVGVDWTVTANGPSSLGTLVGCTDSEVNSDGAAYNLTCTAESGAGVSAAGSTSFKRDASVPTVGVALLGTEGKDHWFTSNVGVDWTVTANGPSSLGTLVGCTDSEVNADGAAYKLTCNAESGAGVKADKSASFKRDASVPSTSVKVTGTKGTEDWFVTPVGINWTKTANGPSGLGVITGCQDVTVNTDGTFSFSCALESGAGITSPTQTTAGKRDATLPAVTYTGNLGSYGIDKSVAISCATSDVTSGVLSDTCQAINGPAYNFVVGQNSPSANATDHAGNLGHGSTSFTVVLTTTNLCSLTQSFSTSSASASSLCKKLENAAAAAARGDVNAKSGMLNAYTNEVQAQTGKTVTAAQAQTLIRLARLL